MLRMGMFLGDRYQILERIGSGGMSDVYKAKCHKLNRLVAIKVLKTEFSSDAGFVNKFRMEAQASAGLSHPNIVNVYDVGDEGEVHYIVMELIEGITLKSYVEKKGRLEFKESIGISIQVAQGIAAAHDQHIIHRDIKPQNMIISRDGKVKVTDFGIARAASTQTINSNAMGSVHYISPEQARGGYSDERSDIYSLGITLYEMVTGRLPYMGENTVSVALAHLQDQMVSPTMYIPDLPISIEKIILKCTEKKPERRYNTMSEVINDLRRALLTPDENFVQMVPMNNNSQTVMISPRELEIIQKETRTINVPNIVNPNVRSEIGNNNQMKKNEEEESEDDVNPKIEKIFSFVGIGVAILIVALLIFVFTKLGGAFNVSPSGKDKESITQGLEDTQTKMPDLLGLTEDKAEAELKKQNLIPQWKYSDSEDYEKGIVMDQETPVNEVISKHSKVVITLSNGSKKIDLSTVELAGKKLEEVKGILTEKKLIPNIVEENNDTVEAGTVIRFEPMTKVDEGDTITLTVSIGPAIVKVKVPNLKDLTKDVAIGVLVDAKLVPGTATEQFDETVQAGCVISQAIEVSKEVNSGTTIDFVVSKGSIPKITKYVATINVSQSFKHLFGPGASSTTIQVAIRLRQNVNGADEITMLMNPHSITADTILPIKFDEIVGAEGVTSGILEVIDVSTDSVMANYNLVFEKKEVATE